MKFKNLKNIIKNVFLIFFINYAIVVFSQNTALTIHTSSNEKKINLSKSFSNTIEIGNGDNMWKINKDSILLSLSPGRSSNDLILNGFNFHLRPVDRIHTIKLNIEGYSNRKIKDKTIQLSFGNQSISDNQASKNLKGKSWPDFENKGQWTYYFYIEPQLYNKISSDSFGVKISLKNIDNDTALIVIKSLKIEIDYYPLVTFCNDELVTFFVDKPGIGYKYNWKFPEEVIITSPLKNRYIINVLFKGENFGYKNIYVKAEKDNVIYEGKKTIQFNDCRVSTIKGNLWLDSNCNNLRDSLDLDLDGISVNLSNEIDFDITKFSDQYGVFSFDSLISDYYRLKFIIDNDLKTDDLNLDVVDDDLYTQEEIFVKPGALIDTLSYRFVKKLHIKGQIWNDDNANTRLDTNEIFKLDSLFLVLKKDSLALQNILVDSTGIFSFEDLSPGNYELCVDDNIGFQISGNDPVKCFDVQLECGHNIDSLSFGIFKNGEISGKVWFDKNENGIRDSSERVMENIKIELLDTTGNFIDTLYTDSLGNYIFDKLKPDIYQLRIVIPDSFDLTILNTGDFDLDNDFINVNEFALTGIIPVASGSKMMHIDCGFIYKQCSLGDFVWLDMNENGIQDANESGINGIKIKLYDKQGGFVQQVESHSDNNGDGFYIFEGINWGEYYVEVEIPVRYRITIKHNIENTSDNDIDKFTLRSDIFTLNPGDKYFDLDIGLVINYGSLENLVWLDLNENGLQDMDETGISGIKLKLLDSESNEIIGENESNAEGSILFDKIVPGNYFMKLDTLPSKYIITSYGIGSNRELDSDFKSESGHISTEVFNVTPGNINNQIDLGLKINYGRISGFVWNDENQNGIFEPNEIPIENIEIQLFDNENQSGNPVSTIFSNSEGEFYFKNILEGEYYIKFLQNASFYPNVISGIDNSITGFFGLGTTDKINVEWGAVIENINGAFVSKKCEVGDFVWVDKNNNGLQDTGEPGIGNIEIKLYDIQGFLVSQTVSSSTGAYKINDISPGKYYLVFKPDKNYMFTIPDFDSVNGSKAIESGDTGITKVFELFSGDKKFDLDAGFISKSAIIGDRIWLDENDNDTIDSGEKYLGDIGLELFDSSDSLVSNVFSDNNGKYQFDGLDAGDYYIKLTNIPDTLSVSSIAGKLSDITGNNGINSTDMFSLDTGQVLLDMDFGLVKKMGIIGDRVWIDENNNGLQDSIEQGLNGIEIILYNMSGEELAHTTTADFSGQSGFYHFDVDPGIYFLRFLIPYAYEAVESDMGDDREKDSNINGEYGYNTTGLIYVGANGQRRDIDAGVRMKRADVGGRVWIDENKDGLMNTGESGIDSILVKIYKYQGGLVDSVITLTQNNKKGIYEFKNLVPGSYYIVFEIPDLYIPTVAHKGNNIYFDSDITGKNGMGSTDVFKLQPGEVNRNIYAGYIKGNQNEISGRVWLDKNENGIMDKEEEGINELEVRLYKINGELQDKKFTEENSGNGLDGYYRFNNISKGEYYIQFINQIGYSFTQPEKGNIDSLNSDVFSIIDFGATDTIIIVNGKENLEYINAGLVLDRHGMIGDRVWEDLDGDGLQEDGEPGINGVLVQLYKKGKGIIGSVLTKTNSETGEDGFYLFDNLSSGEYYIKINIPGLYYTTKPDIGNNKNIDSDINDGNGFNTTEYFYLGVNEYKDDIDAGAYRLGEVGDFVWLDENENGIQDAEEEGVEFIFISVYDENGNYIGTMISDNNGNYRSSSLMPGEYYLKVLGHTAGSFTTSKQGNNKSDSDITNEYGDGTTSLFQILSGQFNTDVDIGIIPSSQINLVTYPNPVTDNVQLSFNINESDKVKIIISNIKGEKIKEINLFANPGHNIVDIDFSKYLDGYYSISLAVGNSIPVKKVVLKMK